MTINIKNHFGTAAGSQPTGFMVACSAKGLSQEAATVEEACAIATQWFADDDAPQE